MSADIAATTNGIHPVAAERAGGRSELDAMRATCRRQAGIIDMFGDAMAAFRRGASALKAENAELRADNQRMRDRRAGHADDAARAAEMSFPPDVQAPGRVRGMVTRELGDRVTPLELERAWLLASELTTNSVRHSGAPIEARLVFRVEVAPRMVRLEVHDPGRDGAIAPRAGDAVGGGGYGLGIVQALSERWGLERVAAGGTRVWAQIALDR